jgi:chromosome segregation ATPase
MAINPLTREQKLLAEIVVQLGNITEAVQSAAAGEDSSDLNNKIDALQSQLAAVSSARAALQQQLAEATTLNADLQVQLAAMHESDITPDNINQVMSTLGIDYEEND